MVIPVADSFSTAVSAVLPAPTITAVAEFVLAPCMARTASLAPAVGDVRAPAA